MTKNTLMKRVNMLVAYRPNIKAVLSLMLIALPLSTGQLHAQTASTADVKKSSDDKKAVAAAAAKVDWSVAQRVYREVDKWVQAEQVHVKVATKPVMVTDVIGVRITLRYSGLTLGVGDAFTSKGDGKQPEDLRDLASKATQFALIKYKESKRRMILALKNGVDPETVHYPLEVDMQVGKSPSSIQINDNAPLNAIYFQFASGFHGLRLTHRTESNRWSVLWPATALALNVLPDNQIKRLLSDVGYNTRVSDLLIQTQKVGRSDGAKVERFEVLHLVRIARGQPVQQLTRGNQLISIESINAKSVDATAAKMANFLHRRILPDGDLAGTYEPTTDRFSPMESPIHEMALAAFALAKRATLLQHTSPKSAAYLNTRQHVTVIVNRLSALLLPQNSKRNPQAEAVLLLTIIEAEHLAELKAARDRLGSMLIKLAVGNGSYRNPDTTSKKKLSLETQAITTTALSALYEQTRNPALAKAIQEAQALHWDQKMHPVQTVAIMPWLSETTFRMHRLAGDTLDTEQKKAWTQRVAAIRALISNFQKKKLVKMPSEIGVKDVVGGYDLINDTGNGARTPDWRSAQILLLTARALSQQTAWQGNEQIHAKFHATLTVRFLAQLMYEEPALFYMRGSKDDTLGGVRLSLWDNRLPTRPTAMSLIAITELQSVLLGHPR